MTETVERHVSKKELEKLLSLGERCAESAADARLPFKGEREKLKKKGLNPWAFSIVQQLARTYRVNPAKVAHNIRALNYYIDQLGYAVQLDIEDAIEGEETKKPNGVTIEKRVAADAAEEAKTGNVVPLGAPKRKRGRPPLPKTRSKTADALAADKYIGRDGKPPRTELV
jgi:hypothetical protein